MLEGVERLLNDRVVDCPRNGPCIARVALSLLGEANKGFQRRLRLHPWARWQDKASSKAWPERAQAAAYCYIRAPAMARAKLRVGRVVRRQPPIRPRSKPFFFPQPGVALRQIWPPGWF